METKPFTQVRCFEMIFVTVGTDSHDFSRLVKKVDEISKDLDEKFIVQLGNTNYKPENCKFFRFLPKKKFEKYIERADTIITHAGVGSIMTCLKYGKKPIVIPRRKKYGEHINDHQLDIAKKLDKEGKIISVYNLGNLKERLEQTKEIENYDREGKFINDFVREFLKKLER